MRYLEEVAIEAARSLADGTLKRPEAKRSLPDSTSFVMFNVSQ